MVSAHISRDFVFFVWRTSRDYLSPPPPAPPTIKHATGVTDNKKYSSRDHESLAIDPGGHHQNTGSYREVPPKRGTFFRPRAYQRIKISLVEVFERVEKSVTSVCKKSQKGRQTHFMAV